MTASLAYGIYEIEYQVMAQNCIMQNKTVSPFLWKPHAQTRVSTKNNSISDVAIQRLGANIFLIWLTGPMRKQVEAKATIFPKV